MSEFIERKRILQEKSTLTEFLAFRILTKGSERMSFKENDRTCLKLSIQTSLEKKETVFSEKIDFDYRKESICIGHIGHSNYQDSGATNALTEFSTEDNSRSVKLLFEEKVEEDTHVDMEKRELEYRE